MQGSRLTRYLRIAVTALSLTACVLLIAFWARSYTTRDSVFWPWIDHAVQVNSLKGHVVVGVLGKEPAARWEPFKIEHSAIEGRFKTTFDNDVLGFYFERKPGEVRLDVPHWFLVFTGMIIAATPWWHEKWRFSVRTLLIATTLVAIGLGLVIYLAR